MYSFLADYLEDKARELDSSEWLYIRVNARGKFNIPPTKKTETLRTLLKQVQSDDEERARRGGIKAEHQRNIRAAAEECKELD